MNTIFPTKQPHEVELETFISHCRVMHFGITGAPRYAHAISALADQRDALQDRLTDAERQRDRARYCLMEMMQAYERRIRSDCTTPEQLAAKPWECAEYVSASRFMVACKAEIDQGHLVTHGECSASDINHRDDCIAKSIGGPCNADCCACNVGNPGVYVKDGRMVCPHRPVAAKMFGNK
jgi:hypothetical protein